MAPPVGMTAMNVEITMSNSEPAGMESDVPSGELADEALDRDSGSGGRFTWSTFLNIDSD